MEISAEQKAALEQQKENCIFCKIVKGEMESKKVYEDDLIMAVLDINPATKGHMLVLPKEHYPIMPLIPPETFKHLFKRVKDLAKCANEGLLSSGTTIFIANGSAAGQQSQHFLLHIIPRNKGDGLSKLDIPQNDIPPDEMERLSKPISHNLPLMIQNHYQRTGGKFPGKVSVPKDKLIGIIEANPPLLEAVLKQPEEFKKLVPNHPQLKEMFADQDMDAILAEIFLKHGKKYPPDEPVEAEFEDKPDEKTEEDKEPEKSEDGEEQSDEPEEDDAESDGDVFSALGGGSDDEDGSDEKTDDDKSEEDESGDDESEDDTDDEESEGGDVGLDEIANLFK